MVEFLHTCIMPENIFHVLWYSMVFCPIEAMLPVSLPADISSFLTQSSSFYSIFSYTERQESLEALYSPFQYQTIGNKTNRHRISTGNREERRVVFRIVSAYRMLTPKHGLPPAWSQEYTRLMILFLWLPLVPASHCIWRLDLTGICPGPRLHLSALTVLVLEILWNHFASFYIELCTKQFRAVKLST